MASKKNKPRNKSAATTPGFALRDRFFNISVKLLPTNEYFEIKKVSNEMKINELKKEVEFATGIPYHMQRLHYLDEADLLEHTDVKRNDIIPGATLHLDIWSEWQSLVEAIASNDCDAVVKLGVTQDTKFSTPNSEYLRKDAKEKWIANRAFTALYLASHRGFMKMVHKLIEKGADVNGRTNAGRTPLHVAAAQGHGTVVDLLLEKGADIDAVDQFGDSALAIASKYGNKGCERHLFLFQWQERAKNMKPHKERGLFAHQHFDSSFPTWLRGRQGQLYIANINNGEDPTKAGSGSKRSPIKSSEQEHKARDAGNEMSVIQEETSNRSITPKSGQRDPFYAWLKRKQAAEQKIIDKIKQEEQVKRVQERVQEEDRLRSEAEKERSYEQWLVEKAETTKQKTSVVAKPQITEQKKAKKLVTVDAIIQDIVARRQQEALRANQPEPALTYQSWLLPDQDIIEDIRLGVTPLQRNLTKNIS